MATRGVVGAQWHKRRIDRDPKEEVTVEIRVPRDMADRMGVVRAMTGETYGRIILRALEALLKGVRLPSIPVEMLEHIRANPRPRLAKSGEEAETQTVPGSESGPDTGESAPPVPLSVAGGGEGEGQPPARPKVDHAAARAKIGARAGRKAS